MDPHTSPKDTLYSNVGHALDNGPSDPVIARQMERLLWTSKDWAKGRLLFDGCTDLEAKAAAARGEQTSSSEVLDDLSREAHDEYMDIIVTARSVVTAPALRDRLELEMPRENYRYIGAWAGQAERFFKNALDDPDTWAALSDLGFTRTMLDSVRASVQEVVAKDRTQERNKGEYQEVSQELQQTRQQLREWLANLYTRARRALRKHPQKQEKLGLVAATQIDV